jgi:integrase
MSNGKPPSEDSLRKPWVQTMKALKISPVPSIHDVRHIWATNAMRSGMDYEIREAILGHALKVKDVSRRYLMIGDADLLRGIDRMSFDHGKTEIWISKKEKPEVAPSGQVWIANG